MSRRRILWLIKGLGLGGAEMLLARALPFLDRDRFEYEVAYVLPRKDALVPAFQEAGVPVHCLGGAAGADPRWVVRLGRLLAGGHFDVVHVHSPVSAAAARILVRVAGRNGSRTKVCYTEHNVWGRYHPITYWANALTYPLNDHALAVSGGVMESVRYPPLLRRAPMPPLEVMHQGIDYARVVAHAQSSGWRAEVGIPEAAPVVGTVGNLKPHKGHEHLVQAARLVLRRSASARFLVVGTGQGEEALRAAVDKEGLRDRFLLTGYREDALGIMAGFQVYAVASHYEGLSIAMLEAMALGVPVVATRVGGIPEAITDGVEGFLVEPRDPAALADRILRLLDEPSLAATMGEAGRRRATSFDLGAAARRHEAVYDRMVAR